MNCGEARTRILGGGDGGDEEALRRHLSSCPACAALAEDDAALAGWLDADAPSQKAPDGMLEALQAELAREVRPAARLRSLSTPARAAVAAAGAIGIVGVGLLGLRPDLGVYPPWRLAMELVALGLPALAGLWVWLRPLHRPALPRWLPAGLLALAVLVPWGLALLPAAHGAHPASVGGTGGDFVARALACFVHGGFLGALLAVLIALVGRGGRRLVRWALLPAAAAACTGLVSLQLHCPLTARAHLLVGHAPVVVALVALGLGAVLLLRGKR